MEMLSRQPEPPLTAEAHLKRGNESYNLGQLQTAIESYGQAITLKPDYANAYNNRGVALQDLQQYQAALNSFDQAIALKPDYAYAYNNRGNALLNLKQHQAALASYDQAIACKPDYAEAYNNRGNVLSSFKQHQAALKNYDQAIALKPDYAEAYYNRGNALRDIDQNQVALASYDQAIALNPGYADAYNNRGNALLHLKQFQAALDSYGRAVALNPCHADAYSNLGNILQDLKQYQAALDNYDQAMALNPDQGFLFGMRLHTRMHICDWRGAADLCEQLVAKIWRGESASPPFPVLSLSDSLPLQRKAAQIWIQEKFPVSHALPAIQKRPRREKIRIGYFSADFHDHATSYLIAELFERHDKSRFELIAFSFGPDSDEEIRKRIAASFDQFIDVRTRSDREIALLSRELEIDIAVDLGGFTQDSRTGIFALRAGPIQVNYLGYPGTMSAEYIDYLIADPTLIPESSRQHYSEKIVYLPDSYQVNDSKRPISDKPLTRAESGLPQSGFVFCSFNINYKITPFIFDIWMRLLKRVEGSVLWLFEGNPQAASNLRREAVQRGVGAERLVFAQRLPLPEHLARHRLADLFLDTFPYNAHTTASDALWAGLPVLTCTGATFASRVAASLLNAMRLPELITVTHKEYEALAIELATNPNRLRELKEKLAHHRLTAPLFDIQRFTRHIEAAYAAMYNRYQEETPPEHIHL